MIQTAETISSKNKTQHIVRLLLGSFRFSRGAINLQSDMLNYVAGVTPEPLLPEDFHAAIEPVETACQKIVDSPKHVDVQPSSIVSMTERMLQTFEDRAASPVRPDAGLLLKSIVEREDILTVPRNAGKIRADGHADYRFHSDLARHAILGRTTGLMEYDAMFDELGSVLPTVVDPAADVDWTIRNAVSPAVVGNILRHHCTYSPADTEPITAYAAEVMPAVSVE